MSTLRLSLVGLGLRLALVLVVISNALLLARVLGPQEFGEYFLFLRVVSVLAVVADLGLSQSANAFYGRHKEWRGSIHRTIVRFLPILCLGTTIFGGLTLWLGGDVLLPHMTRLLTMAAFASLPLSLYANLWNSMMIGMGRIWRVNLMQLAMCSVSLVLTLIFVAGLSGGQMAAAFNYVFIMLVQFVVMLIMALRLSPDEQLSEPPRELSRQMLHFGLRGYLGSVSSLLWTRIPVFILNATHGPVAVGVFSIAQQVVEKMLLPVQAIRDVIYQKMSVLPGSLAPLAMNRYLRLTWWGMVVIVLPGLVVAPFGVVLLLGPAYLSAVDVMRFLLAGAAFAAISLLLDTFFINHLHRPGLVSIVVWFKVAVGLTLAVWLIPKFGANGAAIAMAFTQILGMAVYLALYLRATGTRMSQLIFIHNHDVTLLREQVVTVLRFKEGRG
jgi:O-antigen/teichoic acid export membrane protein